MQETGRIYGIPSEKGVKELLISTLLRQGYVISELAPFFLYIEKDGSLVGNIGRWEVTAYVDNSVGRTLDELLVEWTPEKKGE